MGPKKRNFPWQDKYSDVYGLRITNRDEQTSKVCSVVCRFCESFGREPEEEEASSRKRQKRTTTKHFNESFRTSNIQKHLKEEHRSKWAEYQAALNNRKSSPGKFDAFFTQTRMHAFFEKSQCCSWSKENLYGGQG
eukprot:IDg2291t1